MRAAWGSAPAGACQGPMVGYSVYITTECAGSAKLRGLCQRPCPKNAAGTRAALIVSKIRSKGII